MKGIVTWVYPIESQTTNPNQQLTISWFSLHKNPDGKVKDQMEQSFRDNFQKVAEAAWINMSFPPGRLDATAVWYSSRDVV